MKTGYGTFKAFVRKEATHILRDARTMLIVLLIPMVLMVLFGFAISTEVNEVSVAVVCHHRTPAVTDMVQRLQATPEFVFKGYVSPHRVDALLRSGRVNAVVLIADDYEQRLQLQAQGVPTTPPIEVVLDASNVNLSQAAGAYLQSVLTGGTGEGLFRTVLRHNPQMKSSYNFVPGIMGMIFLLICAMMTSVSIVREKEVGTMEVLLVSPVRPIVIVVAKMVPYLVISLINLATILLLAKYLLEVPMASAGWVVLFSVVYIALSLALGLLVSNMANKQVVALLISAVLMMVPVMMLSGMMFPVENLPPVLRELSCLVPARWYIDAMRKLMIAGVGFGAVWKEFGILVAMTAALMVAALRMFNDKLE